MSTVLPNDVAIKPSLCWGVVERGHLASICFGGHTSRHLPAMGQSDPQHFSYETPPHITPPVIKRAAWAPQFGEATAWNLNMWHVMLTRMRSQVELDVLTGEKMVLAADILFDCGHSLNPAVDIGQVRTLLNQWLHLTWTSSDMDLQNSRQVVICLGCKHVGQGHVSTSGWHMFTLKVKLTLSYTLT